MRAAKCSVFGAGLGVCLGVAGAAWGQGAGECTVRWNTAIGDPGLDSGYAAAFAVWDDGNGERVYFGGSFNGAGGLPAELLVRYDRDTDTYSIPGGGLDRGNTNGFVTSMVEFDGALVVGGFFNNAAGVPDTQSLAAWDGTDWLSLGGGMLAPDAVWGMTVGDLGDGERLIAVGGFASMDGISGRGIAAYDGKSWSPIGLGIGVDGSFNPYAADAIIFDDGSGPALYVCGRFEFVDGTPADSIARFNGTSWEQVGDGVASTRSFFGLEGLVVWDDGTGPALYACGYEHRINGQAGTFQVLKWDGTGWSGVGQNVESGRVTDIEVWDDGSGETLFITGTATPAISYFARLDNNVWSPAYGGVGGPSISGNFPSAFGVHADGPDLFVGGTFGSVGPGQPTRGVAILEGCAGGGDDCPADWDGNGIVNAADVGAFLSDYFLDILNGTVVADFNGDGVTNAADVGAYLSAYFPNQGACP